MSTFTASEDETARIVLAEFEDGAIDEPLTVGSFARWMRDTHPQVETLAVLDLWGRYLGFDGRSLPTHDFRTGHRINWADRGITLTTARGA